MTDIKIGEITINSEDDAGKHMKVIREKYNFDVDTCTTMLVRYHKDQSPGKQSIALLVYTTHKGRSLLTHVYPIHTIGIDNHVDKYERKKRFLRGWKLEN